MNERIRDLEKLATIATYDADGFYIGTKFSPDKFAELIVRECIEKISQEQDIAEQDWQCKNGVHICHELAKHFGVKE